MVLALVVAACGDSGGSPVDTAQKKVSAKEKALSDAQSSFTDASAAFCADAKDYIAAIDRYGKLFTTSSATVGDVKTAGKDLAQPRSEVLDSAQTAAAAHAEVANAEQELADAKADLAAAQAAASGSSTSSSSSTTTTTQPLVPTATVDRVKKAESDLETASKGITDQTPLAQAAIVYNSAAFALEVAWLQLFAQAGCLTDEQAQQAQAAVRDYTVALQSALHTAGYYDGEIDGVYGPSTADAVKELQTASGLPATGYVDQATAAALTSVLMAKGGVAATTAVAHTAAVQSTLKLAGYWTGPVNGQWTPELTTALKSFQTALGVPPTGVVDTATLSALQQAIAKAQSSATTTTTAASTTTTT
ncbi:MAG TPA: peptidoglycan-binding domain-containing protein [Acidimicrobiales bacterium]|nr:peptidoglycan-binding domain-containing protein [Acidimicrobiales bacterium]